ncbi:hypothetical protein RHGRI_014291 [Rhododendron griersonianum]|uniref:Uncharacterized protein n=1 Tax=Rhododendron griersonianum TaxID=479676 RepID=A0AAV6K8V5_9ERIC|nr:hypothetical protein RHGRI_014291 [Rhododendron griersonianum]
MVFLDYNGIQKRYTMKYRHYDGKLVLKVTDNREVNKSDSTLTLKSDCKAFQWESGESLLEMLELRGFVKQVFPLHDETKRKQLLRTWAFNCWDFTR